MKNFSETFRRYDLLEHPFYRAWSDGKLSREQLGLYAEQYASFIKLISEGWENVNENAIAIEEKEHYELWQQFKESLQVESSNSSLPAVEALVNTTKENFKSYAGSLGALYAFEAQQPGTATSKLKGLKDHYSNWNVDETYFAIHANDIEEPALLEEKMQALTPTEKIVAEQACASVCRSLYDALTRVYECKALAN